MPEYTFTGAYPRVLTGLSQCVNAWHYPASGDPSTIPYGSTIEAHPGDSVRTDEPYVHPELTEVEPAAPDTIPVPADQGYVLPLGDTSGIEVLRAAAEAAPADPAPADMTAEGAPAPAEPAAN